MAQGPSSARLPAACGPPQQALPGRPIACPAGSSYRPGCRRVAARAAPGDDQEQPQHHQAARWGLPWPFSKAASGGESEYEIIYVTETDEEGAEDAGSRGGPQQLEAAPQPAAPAFDARLMQEREHEVEAAAGGGTEVPEAMAAAGSHVQASGRPGLAREAAAPAAIAAAAGPAAAATPPAAQGAYWESSAGGWVIAASLLLAVRQGRLRADADRLDVRALQARQQGSRVQSRELRERRAQYLQQQAALKEAEAAKRLAASSKRAEEERRQAALKAAEYEQAAREELERLRARRAAAKKAFEESQSRLDEELAARTAKELALREEAAAKRETEEAAARAIAAQEAAQQAEEARRAAESAERAAREAEERRAAEKLERRQQSIRIEVEVSGRATAGGDSSRRLRVTVSLFAGAGGGRGGGSPEPLASSSKTYESPEEAAGGGAEQAHAVASAAAKHYHAALGDGAAAGATEGLSVRPAASGIRRATGGGGSGDAAAEEEGQTGAAAAGIGAADLLLWRWLLLLKVEAAARQAVGQVAPLAGVEELRQDFQVFARYSAMPQAHAGALQRQLDAVANLVAGEQLAAAEGVLHDVLEWQLEDFAASRPADSPSFGARGGGGGGGGGGRRGGLRALLAEVSASGATAAPASPYLVPACVFALLLDSAQPPAVRAASPAATSGGDPFLEEALAGGGEEEAEEADDEEEEAAGAGGAGGRRSIVSSSDGPLLRLAKHQLEQLAADAPQDSLAPVAASMRALLGRQHPLAAALRQLAERNTSVAARQAREMRRQQRQLARASEVLKGSAVTGPGGLDPSGARMRQALVPVPERTWALRNVANSMLRSAAGAAGAGAAAADEAVGMLRQAAELSAEHYGPQHPGQLSALLDYIGALLTVGGREREAAAAIEAACGVVEAAGQRYRGQQDLLSLVLLYEAAQAELDVPGVLPRDCAAMRRLQRQAADAFSVLETPQANLVMSKRKLPPGSPSTALRQLARDCTEDLGVYSSSRRRASRLEQWNKQLPLEPLR